MQFEKFFMAICLISLRALLMHDYGGPTAHNFGGAVLKETPLTVLCENYSTIFKAKKIKAQKRVNANRTA